jgi:Outer membrane protein beta-barrel domain
MYGKTWFALGAALALGASPAMGQGIIAGWVNAGATITDNGQDVETGTRNGFTAGVVLGRQSGLIGFRTEALYTQKGFTVASGANEASVKADYIDVPIMLKVDALVVRAYAGPQFSFRVACSLDGGNPFDPTSASTSCSDDVESFDFGFKGGVGAKILVFTVDAVGTIGTKNFVKMDKDTINAKNHTFALVLGLALP